MICYRRFGHNEGDEPAFTQPRMYKAIRNHPSVRQIYGDQLVSEGVMTAGEAKAIIDDNLSYLEKEFEAGTGYRPNKADWLEGSWSGFRTAHGEARRGDTSVTQDEIASVAAAMTTVPEGLTINSKLQRIIDGRRKAIDAGEGIDWATAEQLAFGTLLIEGMGVRLRDRIVVAGHFPSAMLSLSIRRPMKGIHR